MRVDGVTLYFDLSIHYRVQEKDAITDIIEGDLNNDQTEAEIFSAIIQALNTKLEDDGLKIGDSQDRKWLPQIGFGSVNNLKPDGFVMLKEFIQDCADNSADKRMEQPGHQLVFSSVRSFVHGKMGKALQNATLAETLRYASAFSTFHRNRYLPSHVSCIIM